MTFAENLKTARVAARITRSQLAKRVGITQTALNFLETGRIKRPRAEMAARIAEALGTTVEALTGPVLAAPRGALQEAEGLAALFRESPDAFVQAATVIFKLRRAAR